MRFAITALGPASRRTADLAGKTRDRSGDRNVDGVDVVGVVLPVQLEEIALLVSQ